MSVTPGIDPESPLYPEKSTDALPATPTTSWQDIVQSGGVPYTTVDANNLVYPEIDTTLLPGVPGQRGPRGSRGPAGPQGPQGTAGPGPSPEAILEVVIPAVSYQHTQIAAASTWTINHNLNFPPNITAFDSGGTQVEGNTVHINSNSLTIQFSVAISGNAVLS